MQLAWLTLAVLSAPPAPAPPPHPGQTPSPYTFVVLGHTRGGPDNGIIPTERLSEVVEDIRRLGPDFLVLTGDLIYGDINKQWEPAGVELDNDAIRSDWDAIDAIFDSIGIPVHRAPGNHDLWNHSTLEIWEERYGPPFQSFRHGDGLFLLLNSCWLPKPGDPAHLPGGFIRGFQLPDDQIDWLKGELATNADAKHVFGFMGHMLWWEDGADWWTEVHPLLAAAPTRAVVSGDLGPWKWSHLERDGIEYIQSTVEFTEPPVEMLRNRESSRSISAQLDNYLVVTVEGPAPEDVRYDVRTVGAMTTGRFTPALYRDINEYDKGTIQRKIHKRLQTPAKLFNGLLAVAAGGFGAGLIFALIASLVLRSRKRA